MRPHVTEQRALQQRRRQSPALHDHHRFAMPRRPAVDQSSQGGLARARFARQQNSCIQGGYGPHLREELFHAGRGAHQTVDTRNVLLARFSRWNRRLPVANIHRGKINKQRKAGKIDRAGQTIQRPQLQKRQTDGRIIGIGQDDHGQPCLLPVQVLSNAASLRCVDGSVASATACPRPALHPRGDAVQFAGGFQAAAGDSGNDAAERFFKRLVLPEKKDRRCLHIYNVNRSHSDSFAAARRPRPPARRPPPAAPACPVRVRPGTSRRARPPATR